MPMETYEDLFSAIDIAPPAGKHLPLFQEAFTHRSAVGKKNDTRPHNERLEFLGDAVLELVVTEYLFRTYALPEGELTNYRSALVKRGNLAKVAKNLNLGAYLRLSRGEQKSGGAENDHLLANTTEAFIGALYLACGMRVTRTFIHHHVLSDLPGLIQQGAHRDAKSSLQEITQGVLSITPVYRVLHEEGMDHDKTFELGVYLGEKLIARGTGRSKKEAQIAAAQAALDVQDTWNPRAKSA